MHYMRELDNIEEAFDKELVVDVTFDNEHAMLVEKLLSSSFQRHLVVTVEVVESYNPVTSLLQGQGDVSADETRGPRDQHSQRIVISIGRT